jgi:hypothetical protein
VHKVNSPDQKYSAERAKDHRQNDAAQSQPQEEASCAGFGAKKPLFEVREGVWPPGIPSGVPPSGAVDGAIPAADGLFVPNTAFYDVQCRLARASFIHIFCGKTPHTLLRNIYYEFDKETETK